MQKVVQHAYFRKGLYALTNYNLNFTRTCVDYAFHHKFNAKQVSKILDLVNCSETEDLANYAISKSRIKKIENFKFKNGKFSSLDEILDLETFGVTVLEKFCDSIVNEQKKVVTKTPKGSAQFLSPSMDKTASITSCLSVHITLNTVAWTRFELSAYQPTAVTDWDLYKIDDKKLTLADLIQVVLYLDRLIPVADVYIFETPAVAQQTAPGSPVQININVQKSQIVSMIALVLANRTNHSDVNVTDVEKDQTIQAQQSVFFLKQYLTSRLFRILVGTERVSNESIVQQLLRTHYNTNDQQVGTPEPNFNLQREIDVPFDLRKHYDEMGEVDKRNPNREYLGQSLLTGLTFIRLCVIKCAESLATINSRKR